MAMNAARDVVEGTLKPDGSLELAGRFRLPPGRVRVTVEALAEPAPSAVDWFGHLRKARSEREAAGARFRTGDEIDAEVDAMRDEWDRP